MESFLNSLEYFFALEFLVDFGDFWIKQCAEIGGEWVNDECVANLVEDWVKDR